MQSWTGLEYTCQQYNPDRQRDRITFKRRKEEAKVQRKRVGGRRNAHIRQSTREEGNPGRRHRKQSSKPCARARSRCEPDFVPPGRRASGKGISTHTGRRRRRRRWSGKSCVVPYLQL